jgi:uncharacterized membrane protein
MEGLGFVLLACYLHPLLKLVFMDQLHSSTGKPVTNVGDNERVLSAIAGSLLLYFVTKKHKVDSLLLLGGGYLLYRAVSGHCPVYGAVRGRREKEHVSNTTIRTHVIVNRPRKEVYAFWRNLENLPLFMKHLEHVDDLDGITSAWKLRLPGGVGDIRWEAKIVKEEEDRELSWTSVAGAPIENTGKINFSDTPGNATRVDVMLSYRAPLGVIGERLSRLLTPAFRDKVEEDIHNFKHYVENTGL